MNCRRERSTGTRRGFSLLEVITAIAVLAVGAVAMLGLFATLLRGSREVEERRIASRVAERVDRIVREEARAGGRSFDAFAAATGVRRNYVASQSGDSVSATGATSLVPAEQFFEIEVERATEPAWSAGSGFVVLTLRVSWPHRGGAVAREQRSVLLTTLALSP